MKKNFFYVLFFISSIVFAQAPPVAKGTNLSPNGKLDNVYDHYGNSYKLSDIVIGKEVRDSKGLLSRTTSPTPMTCGYYNLYFEDQCGMDNPSDPLHQQRRNVVCQVLTDLSNFINSPLTGNNRVNIWVRNISNLNPPAGALGLASSFYNVPYNTTAGFGGIADNEIWKTIHRGIDSYTNVVSPFVAQAAGAGTSGVFYHGMMAFNFADPSVTWNTNLTSTAAFPNDYDLYTVVLHEMTHALGFASLIGSDGSSRLGSGFNYYTRYDRFLKTSTTIAPTNVFLLTSTACSNMYNYVYNPALSSTTLAPTPNSPCSTNTTVCAKAIRYVGASTVPVFTPNCFMNGSSLSHFEDLCVSPNVNDAFFVMTDATGKNIRKRFLKPQERNALGDMGYSVKTTYGVSTTYQGTTTYTGVLNGIPIAGINDGINTDGTFKYTGNAGTAIVINSSTDTTKRILSNDTSASTNFECLQDVFDTTATFSVTSGVGTTNVTFTSSVPGLHLLRYVPRNSTGTQKGNITYIYVFVQENNTCGTPSACNLIVNGNFEEHQQLYSGLSSQFDFVCGWNPICGTESTTILPGNQVVVTRGSTDYFANDEMGAAFDIPCNMFGHQNHNGTGNYYAGMYNWRNYANSGQIYTENIFTQLASNLVPNQTYQLSFDVSLAEDCSLDATQIQAYFSSQQIVTTGCSVIPIANSTMLFNSDVIKNTDTWRRVVINFTADNSPNVRYLYLGGLTDSNVFESHAAPSPIIGCGSFNTTPIPSQNKVYYYLDNVSLIPLNGGSFTLPTVLCGYSQSLPDLNFYLNGLPTNGVFSGTGVSLNGSNTYSLNDNLDMGPGVYTISYTYTNSTGCLVTIYSTTTVEAPIFPVISGSDSAYTTSGNNSTTNSTIIPSNCTALWTITGGVGTITTANNLASVGATWTSLPGELTLTITNSNGCSFTVSQTIYNLFSCDCLDTQYFTYTTSGLTVNFTAQNEDSSCNGNYSYKFLFGDGSMNWGSSQNFSHTYAAAGTYTMTMQPCIGNQFDGCFCYAPYYSQTATLSGNGGVKPKQSIVSSVIYDDVIISPNPTSSNLNIGLNLKTTEQVTVVIRSVDGKELMRKNWNLEQGEQNVNFDLPNSISDGSLFVEVSYRDYKVTKTIVVKK